MKNFSKNLYDWLKAIGKAALLYASLPVMGIIVFGLLFLLSRITAWMGVEENLSFLVIMLVLLIGGFLLMAKVFKDAAIQAPKNPVDAQIKHAIKRTHNFRKEIDAVMTEVMSELEKREEALNLLQSKSQDLAKQEQNMKKKIDLLKNVPLEVADYFSQLTEQNLRGAEKRSLRRDVLFFVLGIIVMATVTLLLTWLNILPRQ